MSQIKSALEIALERTADIKSDASAGKKREWNNCGKKLASDFLADGDLQGFKKSFGAFKNAEKDGVLEGAVKLFMARLQLPAEESEIEMMMKVGQGLELLLPHKGMNDLFMTMQQVFMQYLSSQKQLEAALTQQYMPKLRQKQAELEKRTGQHIELTPMQDPEFVQSLDRNLDALKEQYAQALDEARARITAAAGLN
ncbi:MAG: hypothetical protein MJ159_05395 [Treponemataceae bacterium]|nr:hypothetical protein [Treponemataceae bacterium]